MYLGWIAGYLPVSCPSGLNQFGLVVPDEFVPPEPVPAKAGAGMTVFYRLSFAHTLILYLPLLVFLSPGRIIRVGILVDDDLDEIDAVAKIHGVRQARQVLFVLNAYMVDTAGLCEFCIIRIREITVDETIVIMLMLVFSNQAHGIVVE